ncbi:hypothetical protein [Chryseobacterium camelliae]|uniref:hypothetical protein n=1 Tax=Chryseobacterium camelliae TaxID=1265445 RepID=UPI00285C977A|nr:hypothetical protein [Chryseobacterium camelliae]MDR6514711.1 hypothetical protein [Chryseobacterium camelliae]
MIRNRFIFFFFISAVFSFSAQKPSVVVLGVGHSTQLINDNHQPAVIRAFIDKVKPSAVCIERSPEEFSRNDFYEFTYEQQYTVVPYARKKNIPLYPIDWIPSETDTELGFGLKDLGVPRFARQKEGFLGFTVFTEKSDFEDDLYFAEKQDYINRIASWYTKQSEKTSLDLPRRLFLYRTFLQSKRIQKVLENYSSADTVLVVIGAFHKHDIEQNLAEQGYTIVQPSAFGRLSQPDIKDHFRKQDAYAILSFNLLGMQSQLMKINNTLVDYAMEQLGNDQSNELEFFRIRKSVISGKISPKQAQAMYQSLLNRVGSENWTWTGVKDNSRIDSYFDPFGNLSLKDRIRLEIARESMKLSQQKEFKNQIDLIDQGLTSYKRSMLHFYIEKYLK